MGCNQGKTQPHQPTAVEALERGKTSAATPATAAAATGAAAAATAAFQHEATAEAGKARETILELLAENALLRQRLALQPAREEPQPGSEEPREAPVGEEPRSRLSKELPRPAGAATAGASSEDEAPGRMPAGSAAGGASSSAGSRLRERPASPRGCALSEALEEPGAGSLHSTAEPSLAPTEDVAAFAEEDAAAEEEPGPAAGVAEAEALGPALGALSLGSAVAPGALEEPLAEKGPEGAVPWSTRTMPWESPAGARPYPRLLGRSQEGTLDAKEAEKPRAPRCEAAPQHAANRHGEFILDCLGYRKTCVGMGRKS